MIKSILAAPHIRLEIGVPRSWMITMRRESSKCSQTTSSTCIERTSRYADMKKGKESKRRVERFRVAARSVHQVKLIVELLNWEMEL